MHLQVTCYVSIAKKKRISIFQPARGFHSSAIKNIKLWHFTFFQNNYVENIY